MGRKPVGFRQDPPDSPMVFPSPHRTRCRVSPALEPPYLLSSKSHQSCPVHLSAIIVISPPAAGMAGSAHVMQ